MITEAEAKTKICPLMRHCVNEQGVMQDKDQPLYEQSSCIGSACMGWRFVPRTHTRDTELWSRSKNQKVNAAWGDDSWWKPIGADADKEPPEAVGFCAAVGTVQATENDRG